MSLVACETKDEAKGLIILFGKLSYKGKEYIYWEVGSEKDDNKALEKVIELREKMRRLKFAKGDDRD